MGCLIVSVCRETGTKQRVPDNDRLWSVKIFLTYENHPFPNRNEEAKRWDLNLQMATLNF